MEEQHGGVLMYLERSGGFEEYHEDGLPYEDTAFVVVVLVFSTSTVKI